MANIQTMYRWEGEGTLKHKVAVEVDLDELAVKIYNQHLVLCERNVKKKINDTAVSLGYDNELSLCSYAAIDNNYQKQAQDFIQWKAKCWDILYDYFRNIKNTPDQCLPVDKIMEKIPDISFKF